MLQEFIMENVWLSVPFLYLSTEIDGSGKVAKHYLTPFGYVDVILPQIREGENGKQPYEVTVVGDIDSWKLDDSVPLEFKISLFNFIIEIVRSYMNMGSLDPDRLMIKFKTGEEEITIPPHVWDEESGATH